MENTAWGGAVQPSFSCITDISTIPRGNSGRNQFRTHTFCQICDGGLNNDQLQQWLSYKEERRELENRG